MEQLTYTQQGIYNDACLYEGNIQHNIGGYIALDGCPNRMALEAAIRYLIREQTALRTRILNRDGQPYQCIEQENSFTLETRNISMEDFLPYVKEVFYKPIRLMDYPLYHFELCYLPDGKARLIIKLHHIIADGWSMSVITKQISCHYHAIINHISLPLEKNYNFQSLIKRERSYVESSKEKQAKTFYQNHYQTISASKEKEREKDTNMTAASCSFRLQLNISTAVYEFCNFHRLSVNMFFSALFGLVLMYFNQNKAVYFGLPVYGRKGVIEKDTVGMYTNILPFSMEIDDDDTFIDYMFKVKSQLAQFYKYSQYPFSEFLKNAPDDLSSYNYLYTMNYYNMRFSEEFCGFPSTYHEITPRVQPYHMQMKVYDWGEQGRIGIAFDYRTSIYNEKMISYLYEMLSGVIKEVLEVPNKSIDQIIDLSIGEDKRILSRYFHWEGLLEETCQTTLTEMFMRQTAQHPNRIAVIEGERRYRYAELNMLVMKYLSLFHQHKIKQGDIVAFYAEHSVYLLAALLATVHVGIIFLPLDKGWPEKRKSIILNETAPRLIFIDDIPIETVDRACQFSLQDIDDMNILPIDIPPQRNKCVQYIIYTSGSSGTPKGVMISNEALCFYVRWAIKAYHVTPEDVFALYTSLSFDLTLTSIFVPLCAGSSVKIFRQSVYHPLLDVVSDKDLTIVKATPSHLNAINNEFHKGSRIRAFIVGGEQLLKKTVEKTKQCFEQPLCVYNEYGPTEATIGCMCYLVKSDITGSVIPIGLPIDHASIFLINENDKILGRHVIGEICIAGPGLSEGYFNNKQLSAQKFIDNSSFYNKRIYKTGDLAFINSDNEMIYLGRADRQIKIRGYRVELDEISSKIMQHEAVKNCATILLNTVETKILCTYVVPTEGISPEPECIRTYVAQSLPAYMVPDEVYCIDEIPLTQNGKIDEIKLKAKREKLRNCKQMDIYHVPRSQKDMILHKAVSHVLGLYDLDMKKSFSDLGGDSIKAILLVQRLERENYHLDVKNILVHSSLYELSTYMKFNLFQGEEIPPLAYGTVKMLPVVKRFIQTQNTYKNNCFHSVHIILNQEVSKNRLQKAFGCLLQAHRSLTLNLSKDNESLFYNDKHLDQDVMLIPYAGDELYEFNLYEDLLIRVTGKGKTYQIVINHLVIDYVSWQILLQDLQYLLSSTQIHELPREIASYGDYALAFETKPEERGLFERPCHQTNRLRKIYSFCRVGLLQKVQQTAEVEHQSQIEWLYSLFAETASSYFGITELEIELENYGREKIPDQYQRIVGWFTEFSYVRYRNGRYECSQESEQFLPVIRFNYLGRSTDNYEVFSVVPLKEEILSFENGDHLDYFVQVDCLTADDTCLSFCLTMDVTSVFGAASDDFMERFFIQLDEKLNNENVERFPNYIDEEISPEDLAILIGEDNEVLNQ